MVEHPRCTNYLALVDGEPAGGGTVEVLPVRHQRPFRVPAPRRAARLDRAPLDPCPGVRLHRRHHPVPSRHPDREKRAARRVLGRLHQGQPRDEKRFALRLLTAILPSISTARFGGHGGGMPRWGSPPPSRLRRASHSSATRGLWRRSGCHVHRETMAWWLHPHRLRDVPKEEPPTQPASATRRDEHGRVIRAGAVGARA